MTKTLIIVFIFFILPRGYCIALHSTDSLFSIGFAKFKSGDFGGALEYYLKALKKAEREKNCSNESFAKLQVGRMYYYLKDKRLALSWIFKAKEKATECHIDTLVQDELNYIGSIYQELNIPDSLYYYTESKKRFKGSKNWGKLSSLYAVMGELCLRHLHRREDGKNYILLSEKYALMSKDTSRIAYAYIKRCIYLTISGDCKQGEKYARVAHELYHKIKEPEGEMYATTAIFYALSGCGNKDLVKLHGDAMIIRDSLFKSETAEKVARYKTLYETEKANAENIELAKENNLKTLEIQKNKLQRYILIASIFVLFILLYFLYTNNRLKNRLRESQTRVRIQKERERISRDLHDNVGSQLSYIISGVDTELSKAGETNLRLENISKTARSTINNLRETIWALNSDGITFEAFTDKLKNYLSSRMEHCEKPALKLSINPCGIVFTHSEALNLYRIAQEAVNNVMKYSEAESLDISIGNTTNHRFSMTINDNGKGFSEQLVSLNESYGLKNMRYRAEEIKAGINIHSSIGKGTTIIISI